jgi:hypothetical protein
MTQFVRRPFLFIAKCYITDKWFVMRNDGHGHEEKLATAGSLEEARTIYDKKKRKESE